jgi:CheY-like chemotaxis protein
MGHPKVLCVDGDPRALAATQMLLESKGYAVAIALDGTSALARAREPFNAVVVDYEMPDTYGALAASHLRSVRPELPIILLTWCHDIPSSALREVTAVVLKGGDYPQRLLAKLHELVSRHDIEQSRCVPVQSAFGHHLA